MTYADHPPKPIADARAHWDEAMGRLEKAVHTFATELKPTALTIKAQRDRYENALVKILNWQGYKHHHVHDGGYTIAVPTEYERGANDMLETLRTIAREALN